MAQGDTASGDEYMDEAAALSDESDNDGSYKGGNDSDDDDDESNLSEVNTDDDDDETSEQAPVAPAPVAPVVAAPVVAAPVAPVTVPALVPVVADPERRKVTMTLRGNKENPFGAASGIPELVNHFGLARDILSHTSIPGLRVRFVRRLGPNDAFLVELLPKKISSVLTDIGRSGRGEYVAVEIKGDDATEIPPINEYDLLRKWFTDELGRKRCPPPTSMVSLARAGLKTNVAANGTPGALVAPIIAKIGSYPVYGDDTKDIAVLMSSKLLEYLSKETPANVTAEHAAVCKPAPSTPRKRVSTAPVRTPTLPDEVIDSSAFRREADARKNGKRPAAAAAADERSVKVSRHDVASRLFGAGGTISMGGDGCVTVTLKFQSRAELAAILDAK
jgi:hypothetical protein